MFSTRHLSETYEKKITNLEKPLGANDKESIALTDKYAGSFFLRRLYQQGKQISQIIAYIWRWIDTDCNPNQEVATKLKEYFAKPTENVNFPTGTLKRLLSSNPKDPNDISVEANLLRIVFFENHSSDNNGLLFPMFDEFELGRAYPGLGYLFKVNPDSFLGMIEDPDRNLPDLIKFNIPFPPRPNIGNGTVTEDELEEWVNNRIPNKYFSDNPYIPSTSS